MNFVEDNMVAVVAVSLVLLVFILIAILLVFMKDDAKASSQKRLGNGDFRLKYETRTKKNGYVRKASDIKELVASIHWPKTDKDYLKFFSSVDSALLSRLSMSNVRTSDPERKKYLLKYCKARRLQPSDAIKTHGEVYIVGFLD